MRLRKIFIVILLLTTIALGVGCSSNESSELSGTYEGSDGLSLHVTLTFDEDILTWDWGDFTDVYRYSLPNGLQDSTVMKVTRIDSNYAENPSYTANYSFKYEGDCIDILQFTACKSDYSSENNYDNIIKFVGICLGIAVIVIVISSGSAAAAKAQRRHRHRAWDGKPTGRTNQRTGCLTNLLILAIAGFIASLVVHYWAVALAIFVFAIIPILLLFVLRRFTKKSVRWLYFNWDRLKPWEIIRNRRFKDKADKVINKALKNVDSLDRHFRDEQEANQQLYASLKAFAGHMRIIYEPRYNGENVGDIQIGNIVIEGKLDLFSKTETDRLIGQIQYCCSRTPFKMRIVIYGNISQEARSRIYRVAQQYPKKRVWVIYLSDPKRRRRERYG